MPTHCDDDVMTFFDGSSRAMILLLDVMMMILQITSTIIPYIPSRRSFPCVVTYLDSRSDLYYNIVWYQFHSYELVCSYSLPYYSLYHTREEGRETRLSPSLSSLPFIIIPFPPPILTAILLKRYGIVHTF
jgi:hypothetical protein